MAPKASVEAAETTVPPPSPCQKEMPDRQLREAEPVDIAEATLEMSKPLAQVNLSGQGALDVQCLTNGIVSVPCLSTR